MKSLCAEADDHVMKVSSASIPWNNANGIERKDENKQKTGARRKNAADSTRAIPQPDLQLSSYQSWDEVGRWYASLQRDRVKPSSGFRRRQPELTKGANDDLAKIRTIYNFVSTRYRYIGIAFGIGRYQPHSAAMCSKTNDGDCQRQATLLLRCSMQWE